MNKPKIEVQDVEFVEVIEEPSFAPLGVKVERFSGYVLNRLEKVLKFCFLWLVLKPSLYLLGMFWKGVEKTVDRVWKTVVDFVLKALLRLLVVGFLLLFIANGFSISQTFSLDGLEILWRAFK